MSTRIEELEKDRDRLLEALKLYGQHNRHCAALHPSGDHPCTCGFNAVLVFSDAIASTKHGESVK